MKLKLLVAALALSASGIASASAVAVNYEVYNLALHDTGIGGSVNGFVGNNSNALYSSPANYWIKFSVSSSAVAGATSINWDVQSQLAVQGGVKADGGLTHTPVAISVEQLIGSTNVAAYTDSVGSGNFLFDGVTSTKVDNGPGAGVGVAAGGTYDLDPASKLNVDSGVQTFLGASQTEIWVYMWGDNTTTVVSSYSSMIENYALAFATADATFNTPEPTTALLAGLGLLGAAAVSRRRKA